jgi:hypothetical protein
VTYSFSTASCIIVALTASMGKSPQSVTVALPVLGLITTLVAGSALVRFGNLEPASK